MDCAANASFDSIKSKSPTDQPAFSRHFREAGMGPVPMMAGSTPALLYAAIVTIGVKPNSLAFASLITNTAAAPSLRPEAFPAVTVPSRSKAGRSLAKPSAVVPGLGYSSVSKTIGSPRRCGISTGTNSSAKTLSLSACSARDCEVAANASWSSRLKEYFFAIFSAVLPI